MLKYRLYLILSLFELFDNLKFRLDDDDYLIICFFMTNWTLIDV
jgi:hypothetical protein